MPIRADSLFQAVFGMILDSRSERVASVDALIMATVVGDGGGVWTLDLREGGSGEVHEGRTDDADLHLVLSGDFLNEFLSGDYDSDDAVENGRLGIVGDPEIFDAFVDFLIGQPERGTA